MIDQKSSYHLLKWLQAYKNKILVAMAMNKPIIATKESIGEIGKFIDNKDIIITNDNEHFAYNIIELLSNKKLIEQYGQNGPKIIRNNFSWGSTRDKK